MPLETLGIVTHYACSWLGMTEEQYAMLSDRHKLNCVDAQDADFVAVITDKELDLKEELAEAVEIPI